MINVKHKDVFFIVGSHAKWSSQIFTTSRIIRLAPGITLFIISLYYLDIILQSDIFFKNLLL